MQSKLSLALFLTGVKAWMPYTKGKTTHSKQL